LSFVRLRPFSVPSLVVLENDMYVRNFVTSGALDGLLARGDCRLAPSELVTLLPEALRARGFEPEQFITTQPYTRHSANIALTVEWNILSMRAMAKSSRTFAIKTQKQLYRSRSKWSRLYPVLALPTVFKWISQPWFIRRFQPNPSLKALIETHRPQVVVFPVTGVESTGTELVALSKAYGFKTLFMSNGWDNLSSKGIMPLLPDVMGVWGPQSAQHAITCQGMPADQPQRIALLGCARYEDYFKQADGPPPPPIFEFPYLLFAGATVACDELTSLRQLDQQLDALKQAGQCPIDLTLIYRPHPWREPRNKRCDDTFDPDQFKHCQLDPQVAEAYLNNKRLKKEAVSANHYPTLTYYTSLLQHALMVVSPMSSMTLEAALFNVPTLILAMDDGLHRIPPHLQAQYSHFNGGRDVPGWVYVDHQRDLSQGFNTLLKAVIADTPKKKYFAPQLRQAMKRFLQWDDSQSYAQRLARLVESLKK
jgi:hypothetical protein